MQVDMVSSNDTYNHHESPMRISAVSTWKNLSRPGLDLLHLRLRHALHELMFPHHSQVQAQEILVARLRRWNIMELWNYGTMDGAYQTGWF